MLTSAVIGPTLNSYLYICLFIYNDILNNAEARGDDKNEEGDGS